MRTNRPDQPGGRPSRPNDHRGPRPAGGPPFPRRRDGSRPPAGGRPQGLEPARIVPPDRDLLYGRNAVAEALRGKRQFHGLMIAESVQMDQRMRQIEGAAKALQIPVDRVPRELIDDLVRGNHQGIVLEASRFPYAELETVLEDVGTVLMLDHLQDPQNLGTLIRAAEAAGVIGIIIPENRTAEITPSVVNASAGAVELIPVVAVPNLSNAAKAFQQKGWWVAALDSGDDALDIHKADIPLPLVLIVGSEGEGVSNLLRKNADLVLAIPMVGQIDSLNAATAGSIAVFEIFRRQNLLV